ncbi:MAG: GntR family transcriptional regulator [Rhodococcus sp.]|jgi:GntR family phosphonate transport system transcriptional regulator|nr:GntR family transcriptional regulator [Rhodococcus sp. (in: high G+C Gram-positive bacteria)]MBJ7321674.1 GntR family transcriptional regulator [Rhodococcus sp. (in: high G+C Gram-positive bacteria)]
MGSIEGRDVTAHIAAEIQSLPAGSQVPSENRIASRFGVSRSVARQAILELESRFLVRRVQGSGTYVNRRIDYVISHSRRPSLHQTVREAGGEARTSLISSEPQPVPEGIAEHFGCAAGTELTRLERLGRINGRIAVYFDEWINTGVMDDIEVALPVIESVEEILRAKGHNPIRALTRGMLDVPPDNIADQLYLAYGGQAWNVESLTNDGDTHQPLMFSAAWTRPDVVRMIFELDSVPGGRPSPIPE